MTKIWLVVERDIRMFLRYKFLLIMRAVWFFAQISLFGLVASQMISAEKVPNYFQYYAAGVGIMMLYSTAMFIGYDIYEEADHGVVEYLLSLPISRRELVIGRSIGGGIRSFVYVGPMLVFILYIIGLANPINFLIAFASLFLFAFGVSGMSITIAVGIRSRDKYDIFLGVFNALIVRLSTAMYPRATILSASTLYGNVAAFNPMTFASDLFRWGTGIEYYLTSPLLALIGLFMFFSAFTLLGVAIYEKKLEGGAWE